MVTTIDSDSEDDLSSIFQEPESFRAPPPKPTKVTYTLQRGSPSLHLNLIGSSPLWGHILWHTSTTLAGYLEQRPSLVRGKSILEFGAGAGLPGLVSAILGAKTVCVTDYPDVELVQNLESNVVGCRGMWDSRADVVAEGFLWGSEPGPKMVNVLLDVGGGYDVLILSDLLFNHSEHGKLLASVKLCMRKGSSTSHGHERNEDYPRALVFFTPHRPWLYEKDLAFFQLARKEGFAVQKIFEEVLDKPMFVDDRGDEKMRRTVEGWELRW